MKTSSTAERRLFTASIDSFRRRAAPEEIRLPKAPSDAEKYSYLQPQQRQLVAVQTIVSVTLSVVLTYFFLQHPVLMPFVLVTMLNIAYALVSAITGMRKRRIDLTGHLTKVVSWAPERFASVDVFLPSAGEPLEILANTFLHVADLRWEGRLKVLVLDDSGRPDVELLALQYGFEYHSRPNRGHLKKAGNLRYGYEHSTGDLITVFDADFCPRSDYLYELVPYFDDSEVGIVQSPQYFDTHGRINWLQSAAGSVQEIFYRWVQPSRDASNGAICVGTCAIYRRAGLASSGGFAQIGHSEDVHTGVNLMKVGFLTRYVPVVVAAGLCPDNYAGFLSQQYRWCAGSMSLLKDIGFQAAPLTIMQRACFFTGFLYYLSTAVTFFGGPLAVVLLVWSLPEQVWPWVYLPFVVASWCVFSAWKATLTTRWNLSVMRVQMLYSAAHALAIWHALVGRTAAWVPTGAAQRGASLPTKITRLARGWLIAVEVALTVGVARGVLEYGVERFWLSIVLTILAVAIVVPTLYSPRLGKRAADQIREHRPSKLAVWVWLAGAIACLATLPVTLTL